MIEYITLEEFLENPVLENPVLSRPRAEKAYRAETGKRPKFHKGKYGPTHDY